MAFLTHTNRAISTLDGNITDVAVTLDVQAGDGALFPAAFDFHITCEDEIMVCTGRAGDTLTITRGAEGTANVAHVDGKTVELRITSGLLDAIETEIDTKIANVVEDATPQLGGDLDLNSKNIDFPSTANVSDCKDEDDMASDSATMLATQQSIKAYVDAVAAGKAGITVGDTTLYVDLTGGNDSTGDGSSGTPWLTIQKALDYLVANTPWVAHNIIIGVNKGTSVIASKWDFAGLYISGTLTIKAMDGSDNDLYASGTASAGAAQTITGPAGTSYTTNFWAGAQIAIYNATGVGQYRTIISNTNADPCVYTISSGATDWATNPDNTSKFIIVFPKIDGDGSLNRAIDVARVDNVYIYGFWWDDFTEFTFRLITCFTWQIMYHLVTCPSGRGLYAKGSTGYFGYDYLHVSNYGVRSPDHTMFDHFACCVKRNGAAGTGYGNYCDREGVLAMSSSNKNTYIDWATGIHATLGGLVQEGASQTYINCTTDWDPVGATDPKYIS